MNNFTSAYKLIQSQAQYIPDADCIIKQKVIPIPVTMAPNPARVTEHVVISAHRPPYITNL